MKKVLTALCMCLCCFNGMFAQAQSNIEKQVGKIALCTYIQQDEPIGPASRKLLTQKLNQIITQSGCAGDGFDSRFIVTAHLQPLDEYQTSTVPIMTAVDLAVTIYVGDGENGTLFSSYYTEVKGVGESRDDAWKNAIRKIPNKNPEMTARIEEGKAKIVEYYNSVGPNIIAKAQAAAKAGNYDEAVANLIMIPAASNLHEKAMNLIGQYTKTAADNANLAIINEARAAWSTSPDESGARKAEAILARLDNPSAEVLAACKSLTTEITSRVKKLADREFAFEQQQAKWEHEMEVREARYEHQETMQANANAAKVQIATVNAAARVATAYYNSRPRIVHHVHWW